MMKNLRHIKPFLIALAVLGTPEAIANSKHNANAIAKANANPYARFNTGGGSSGSNGSSASAGVGTTIVEALEITAKRGLDFGVIVPSATQSGTVRITPRHSNRGVVTCSTELTCLQTGYDSYFYVRGIAGRSINVTYPSEITLVRAGGSETMVVRNMEAVNEAEELISSGGQTSLLNDRSGRNLSINLGGTLEVAANQAPGKYNGAFTVSVEYD